MAIETETVGGETFWFDAAAADAACAFFPRYLRHTEGEWYGRPFELADWQRDRIIRPVFGWKRADGTRRYRVAFIEIPRKNGKTELAAGISLLLLLADGEPGAQVYALAVDKDQAKLVFNKAVTMVGLSDVLRAHAEPYKTSIYCPALVGSFKPLSSNPATKHGFSPSGVVGDEVHEWPDGELAKVVHEGTGARRQPLEVYITTAGIHGQGYGWELHDKAVKVLAGEIADPSFLPVIFAADPDDDWTDEAVWKKANPGLGVSPKIEFLRAECAEAQSSPRKENRFRRYYLNQWTEQAERWLDVAQWRACAGPVGWQELPEALTGRRCFAGVDLSAKLDLTALVYLFPPELDGEPWHVVPRFFLPRDNMEKRVKRDRVPYDTWARAGALELTEGNVVDYAWVEQRLREDGARFEIAEVAFDPWNATQFAVRMQEEGVTMVESRQGYRTLSEPSKELESLVISGRLAHGGHPVLDWNARNVAITTDPAGNIKPAKDKSTERIDGIAATVSALSRALVSTGPKVSVYESRGVRVV